MATKILILSKIKTSISSDHKAVSVKIFLRIELPLQLLLAHN